MPQPLSRVAPAAGVIIGNAGDRPLERHPKLAAVALGAIASWSNVEAFLLRLFVQLLGGTDALATSVYLALEGQSAKTKAIRAAAESALKDKPKVLAVLNAVLAIAGINEKDRNKLAHWTWGDSADLPDALLLLDPRVHLDALDRSKVFVYREQDFRTITHANDRLCEFCQGLTFVLGDHIANRNGDLMEELYGQPEIAERIARHKPRLAPE